LHWNSVLLLIAGQGYDWSEQVLAVAAESSVPASSATEAALDALLVQVLLPGTVETVSAQLRELGVQSIDDLKWATDAELTAMGVKPVPLRKLRHAAAGNDAPQATAVPTVKDPEQELQCLRSGRTDCTVQEPESRGPVDQIAKESPPSAGLWQPNTWDEADESELKTLLLTLSSSVAEKVRRDAIIDQVPVLSPNAAKAHLHGQGPKVLDRIEHATWSDVSVDQPTAQATASDGPVDLVDVPQPTSTPAPTRDGLYPSVEAALDAARHGSTVAPLPARNMNSRRERLSFIAVSEASVLVEAGRLRAALQLQQDALLIDDSAAAAHYNNIGVTHARLREMVHASEALDRALAAASVGAKVWSEVRSGATQATILSNKWRLEKLQQLPFKERSKAPGKPCAVYCNTASLIVFVVMVTSQVLI
jgi:hypothetical protein